MINLACTSQNPLFTFCWELLPTRASTYSAIHSSYAHPSAHPPPIMHPPSLLLTSALWHSIRRHSRCPRVHLFMQICKRLPLPVCSSTSDALIRRTIYYLSATLSFLSSPTEEPTGARHLIPFSTRTNLTPLVLPAGWIL